MSSTIHLKFPTAILGEGTRIRIVKYDKRPELVGKDGEIGSYSKNDNTYECWLSGDSLEGTLAFCKPEDFELLAAPSADKNGDAETKDVGAPTIFGVGDRVRGKETGNVGVVISLDADGDPKVLMERDSEAQQRFGKEFEVISKGAFEEGDRVRGTDSGKLGTVLSVDADGDPKVIFDGESEALQRFGREFIVIEKRAKSGVITKIKKRSRSKSKGGKKKKNKKKKSSSSSSRSSYSDKSWHKRRKTRKAGRSTTWGHSALERAAEDRKRAEDFKRKYGYDPDAPQQQAQKTFQSFDVL